MWRQRRFDMTPPRSYKDMFDEFGYDPNDPPPDDADEVWREMAQLSADEEEAVREFNAGTEPVQPDRELPPDDLPF
jgi:hypothetical protein